MSCSGDTIAALATPSGYGGIGIVRLSGPAAWEIARRLFHAKHPVNSFATRKLYHGDIISPLNGQIIDEVLISFMAKPRSFTGEDMVEINCHGGPLIVHSLLKAATTLGARLAEPGEFTKRAFLNGRLDLSQAEAILDVIRARTENGLARALGRLRGDLEMAVGHVREGLLDTLAILEAAIDFSDEDLEVEATDLTVARMDSCRAALSALMATYQSGRIHQNGLHVMIVGKPNIGKSSLLNALIGTDRAIVTATPGTTRDFIEESMMIGGIPVTLMDTAGIRDPADEIEKEGIGRVWEKLALADLILLVFDGSRDFDADDFLVLERTREQINCLVVINKTDLPQRFDLAALAEQRPGMKVVTISAKYKTGLAVLQEEMGRTVALSGIPDEDTVSITSLRHLQALTAADKSLEEARTSLLLGKPPEIVALDLREALGHLDGITGRALPDEVLDRIFASFCIGK